MAKKGQKFKEYDYETKLAVATKYLEGYSSKELLDKYKIKNDSQIESWARTLRDDGPEGLRPKKRGRKAKTKEQTELNQLRMENEILKKIRDLLEQEKP